MRTFKQDQIEDTARKLLCLGLVGADVVRLARRIVEGKGNESYEQLGEVLANSCRETIGEELDFLVRFVDSDMVVYGPTGYAVVDHVMGTLEFAFPYGRGQSFDSMTAHHAAA